MDYITTKEAVDKWGITHRMVQHRSKGSLPNEKKNYCHFMYYVHCFYYTVF